MSTVWFMVDDTDPRLNYSGSWTPVLNTNNFTGNDFDQTSETGPAFNSTLHSTKDNATISFRFNGSSYLGVYGTLDGTSISQDLPDITCLLDGQPTWAFDEGFPSGHANNNMLACRADSRIGGSSPGEHELLINVTNPPNTAWYFDYITYESLVDPSFDGEVLQAGNSELIDASNYSMLSFGPGWSDNPDDSSTTSIPGSFATVKFNGTSLSLYGDLLNNISNTASYQIDAQDPVTVHLSAFYPIDKQLLFTASDLAVGEHTVVVTFNGTKSGMPLDVNYFYVQSLTAAQQASVVSPSPSPPASSAATASSSVHSNRGVILGAVLGTLIPMLILATAAVMWYWRRSKRRRSQQSIAHTFEPDDLVTTSLTNQDIASADQTYSTMRPFSNEKPLYPLRLGVVSTSAGSSLTSTDNDTQSSNGNRGPHPRAPPANNAQTLKLEQRLAIMQEQIQQRDQQLADGSVQQQRMITVHTDSGMRLTGENALLELNQGPPIEVPPGYTIN